MSINSLQDIVVGKAGLALLETQLPPSVLDHSGIKIAEEIERKYGKYIMVVVDTYYNQISDVYIGEDEIFNAVVDRVERLLISASKEDALQFLRHFNKTVFTLDGGFFEDSSNLRDGFILEPKTIDSRGSKKYTLFKTLKGAISVLLSVTSK